ncbi:MAG: heme ABC exporter ATP-binding protein CcmA, partial [Gemmatimonadaceae bacterium]|nr:heme ABC exporter ATP-binding protein CcmA [Gemmatimonadaceae bacterium]
ALALPFTDERIRGERTMTARVEAAGLVRAFGARRAVDGLSFSLGPGDCLALFGPNGAGKTTALRLLAGLLSPTAGTASIEGVALPKPDARARVGLISHRGMLYEALTARENVRFSAQLHGLADPDGATQRALEQLRVADRADVAVRALSRGLQQRVAIARAIVHAPDVLLADEPYTGLDEQGGAALTALLRERRDAGAALIVVTHHLHEGLALATHAAIMRAGRFARFERAEGLERDRYAADYRELVA